jgi:hypothetical protein
MGNFDKKSVNLKLLINQFSLWSNLMHLEWSLWHIGMCSYTTDSVLEEYTELKHMMQWSKAS